MEVRRGLIFVLDAAIASLLAIAILSSVAYSFRTSTVQQHSALSLDAFARDALTVADKQGLLKNTASQSDAEASSALTSFLDNVTPARYSANVTAEWFEYKESGGCSGSCSLDGGLPANNFCTCRRLTAGSAAPNPSFSASARRILYVELPNERFGRVTIEVRQK